MDVAVCVKKFCKIGGGLEGEGLAILPDPRVADDGKRFKRWTLQ